MPQSIVRTGSKISFLVIGICKIFSTQKCITVGVSQVCKMFHASKMMSSFTGKPFGN